MGHSNVEVVGITKLENNVLSVVCKTLVKFYILSNFPGSDGELILCNEICRVKDYPFACPTVMLYPALQPKTFHAESSACYIYKCGCKITHVPINLGKCQSYTVYGLLCFVHAL